MTKKDYQLLASALYLGKITAQSDLLESPERLQDSEDTALLIATTISDKLELENPRFNRKRFIKACMGGR